MNKKYELSVIIPFYNSENHLSTAFESVLNQTLDFSTIEVIFVNDCSSDSSPQIAEDCSNKYPNCKYYDLSLDYCKKSGFPGRPRNLGLRNVNSDYVVFLDTDDEYTPEAFEILLKSIKENDVDLVCGNYYLINDNGEEMKNNLCPNHYKKPVLFNPKENQEIFNKITNITFISTWGKIFRYKFLLENKIEFIEDGPVEDADFYFKCLSKTDKMVVLPETYIYYYKEYSNSTIRGNNKKLFLTFLKGFKRINSFQKKNFNLSCEFFFNEYLSSLLLIFTETNTSKNEKKELLELLYDFEKENIDYINIRNFEVKFLNNLVLKRLFGLTIIVANFYSFFYNNSFIKALYRKYNNRKRKIS